jgi:DNA polymerase-3 subunit delta'
MNYGDDRLVRIEGKDKENFRKLAPFIHRNNGEGFIQAFDEAHYHVERNANFKILFMDLSFRLYHLLNSKVTS